MDKQTLSNYGWVIIITLILAVMLALATPFGKFVGENVTNLVKAYSETSDKEVKKAEEKAGEWDALVNNVNKTLFFGDVNMDGELTEDDYKIMMV